MTTSLTRRLIRASCIPLILLFCLSLQHLNGAGVLVADGNFGGQFSIEEHRADVVINNGIAVTTVTQVFRNMEQRIAEARYLFPIPKSASVANFSMWINGKEMTGEVVERERARQIYESYKQTRKDPGLLEERDFKTFEMKIFPIAAGGQQKIQIAYYQELNIDHDVGTWVYPLASSIEEVPDSQVNGAFSVNISVKSEIPIVKLESPSHREDVVSTSHGMNYHRASLEIDNGTLSRDVVFRYHLNQPQLGLNVITSNQKSDDGYYLATLSAATEKVNGYAGRDYVFLIDVSGSMRSDGKLLLSKQAVQAFIQTLSPEDRFEIVTFNIRPEPVFGQLQAAEAERVSSAIATLNERPAAGGTELQPAIDLAWKYANNDRQLNVVVLSDGMSQVQDRRQLIAAVANRPANSTLFCVGVGNRTNKPLLQQLANDSGGVAAFLSHEDDFAYQAEAFRRKLTMPAISDLSISIDGIDVTQSEPQSLGSLYHGEPIRLYGRYKSSGTATIKVSGGINGIPWSKTFTADFPKQNASNPEIERMWATKRIETLKQEINRSGERSDLIETIVRLGETYSITSPYTSFIVLENDAEYQRWRIERRNVQRIARDRQAQTALNEELTRLRERSMQAMQPQVPESIASNTSAIPGSDSIPTALPQSPQLRRQAPVQPNQNTQNPAPRRNWNFGGGGGGGGGAIDPFAALLICLLGFLGLVNRKKQSCSKE